MDIKGSVCVVTGGASGLGEATVRILISKGAKVGILDMNVQAGEALAAEFPGNAVFAKTDVTNEQDVSAALDAIERAFGTVSCALNFAGIAVATKTLGRDGPHPLDSYQKVIDINLVGTFNVNRLASERMQKNTPNADGELGVIVNTASIAAYDGQKGQVAYAASKGGVVGMTLPMARDLASYGVRVNTIAPGLIMTPMLAGLPLDAQEALAKQPLFPKRLGRPDEIARLACFMIECPYINAETVRLDAGIRLP
jgi:3-hydroxyacyl-CoA dehydrogenase/3-hydroxy-2-methylbutyryl-CoA dehydrogenase